LDHLQNTKGFHLRQLKYLVMDEADRMLSMDFEKEINQILEVIPDSEKGRRTMLFSATMTSKVEKLQRASLVNPVKVEVSTKFQTPKKLLQSYLFIPAKYKDCYLTYLINEHAGQSILVFGSTCNNVQRLALMLRNLGFPAICLHGQMSQPKRLGALTKFKAGGRDILICTDVASRGLDIPSVDVVINFDLPGHGKDYIHRVGRTARAGKSGKAMALVTQYDVEVYQRLEHLLGQRLPEYKLPEEEVLLLLERVNEAQRLATRELKEQIATRDGNRKSRKRGKYDEGDGDTETAVRNEMKRGFYAGGSGGNGGGYHNQRGGGNARKKNKQRR
jgi:ATP-dependent RNA helicase DDX47/RRP3